MEQLIILGDFKEAMSLIEDITKKKGLSKEDRLACKVLKSDIQNDLGKHKEALALAEEVLKESSGLDNALLQLDALIQKAGALFLSTGKVNDALNCIEEGIELLKTIPSDVPAKELAERKAWLLNWKGFIIFFHLGDFPKSIELLQESLSFAEESGNKRIIALVFTWLGIVYLFLSDYMKKAEECLVKAKKTAEEIGNKLLLSLSYSSLGALLGRKKEFDQAIEFYKKSLSFVKEVGSTFFVAIRYNDLGLIYQAMFQLDEALECYQKALIGMDLGRQMLLANIGYTS